MWAEERVMEGWIGLFWKPSYRGVERYHLIRDSVLWYGKRVVLGQTLASEVRDISVASKTLLPMATLSTRDIYANHST